MSQTRENLQIYDISIFPPSVNKNGENNHKKHSQSNISQNFQKYKQNIYLNQAELIKESYDQKSQNNS